MTTWANIESGSKRGVNEPADAGKQVASRASATAGGSYASFYDNSAGTSSVVAHVLTENNCQLAVAVTTPGTDHTRSYVVLANSRYSIIVPPGYKLWLRDLS